MNRGSFVAVYVDAAIWPYRGKRYCHMIADTLAELHSFAADIGLKRCWYSAGPPRGKAYCSHYDVSEIMREKAIAAGAVPLKRAEFMQRVADLRLTY